MENSCIFKITCESRRALMQLPCSPPGKNGPVPNARKLTFKRTKCIRSKIENFKYLSFCFKIGARHISIAIRRRPSQSLVGLSTAFSISKTYIKLMWIWIGTNALHSNLFADETFPRKFGHGWRYWILVRSACVWPGQLKIANGLIRESIISLIVIFIAQFCVNQSWVRNWPNENYDN